MGERWGLRLHPCLRYGGFCHFHGCSRRKLCKCLCRFIQAIHASGKRSRHRHVCRKGVSGRIMWGITANTFIFDLRLVLTQNRHHVVPCWQHGKVARIILFAMGGMPPPQPPRFLETAHAYCKTSLSSLWLPCGSFCLDPPL